jgi:hypothetical protein
MPTVAREVPIIVEAERLVTSLEVETVEPIVTPALQVSKGTLRSMTSINKSFREIWLQRIIRKIIQEIVQES